MQVVLASTLGFCFGVTGSVNAVRKAQSQNLTNIQTLGPLVHNPQLIAALEKEGVHVVQKVSDAKPGTLIIRSHGVTPQVLAEAKARSDLTVIDATCPLVKVEQDFARKLVEEGYRALIIGEHDHAEAIGAKGHAQDKAIIIETIEEAEQLPFSSQKTGVVVQTTLQPEKVEKIIAKLFHKSPELRIFNTICQATKARQPAAKEAAQQVQVMFVVGGKNSGNTTRLADVCRDIVPTYHIETEAEIKPDWLRGRTIAGVTAGASTPPFVVDAVVKFLQNVQPESGTPADLPSARSPATQ
jgi:4-hydroxy-3-methylbut-2-enyl diphosphate reductase